ncbi:hypothetical protein [Arthrobacter sp.]|uniref:hypothetical protein n=1 Tax=Arthrobacter sp. TaxID=1667 RepID=UPI002811A7FD|nr:hypothetical protein [Arthrobacter sp.]
MPKKSIEGVLLKVLDLYLLEAGVVDHGFGQCDTPNGSEAIAALGQRTDMQWVVEMA